MENTSHLEDQTEWRRCVPEEYNICKVDVFVFEKAGRQ